MSSGVVVDRQDPGVAGEAAGIWALMTSEVAYAWSPQDVLAFATGDGQLDWQHLGTDAVVEHIAACQRLLAQVQASQLAAVAELAARRGDERATADEVALETAVGKHAADRQVDLARQLCERFPKLHAAMARGELDATKASRVCDTAAALPDEQAGQLDEFLHTRVAGRTAGAIQQSARYQVDRLDPDGAARRAEHRRRDRRVELLPGDDGMAELCADLPAEIASAAYTRIDTLARACQTTADERTLDQVRADVLAELLLGHNHSGRRIDIQVTVPADTLLGTADLPGMLGGYGPLPAPVVRELAADPTSTWRRLLTDPASGHIIDVGRTRYRPPASMARYVRTRDQHCRFPGCHRPAQHCDLDHNTAWQHGGTTTAAGLTTLCRRHHQLKDQPGWHYHHTPTGDLIITTPSRRHHTSQPPPAAEPQPEPSPPQPHPNNDPPPF
ncbi:DUF222 domain-containing protein [Haloechinothrix sp. LS1_15]|uniref:DUF222 domain-containing protein n=1 Tax=Haloechinothrix sp. LS1_15 TaxID=2652248 RepID=UPI002945C615|nr:DUF222 domain-containing protein [Haloechinothrix sp. LS1_15]MDV6011242.1 DUF222 domain-containing protein [Haloechinothrix sp. LS1_15]